MTKADDLILLPGTLCDARVFAPVLTALGVKGTSILLEGADNAPDMARRILGQAPARFAICGFSLGAIVALEVVAQAAGRVTRLALIGGNARTLAPDVVAARRASLVTAEREGTASYIASAWDASVPASRRNDAGLRTTLETMARDTPLAAFRDQIEISIDRREHRPTLPAIAVPTLVLCGAEDRVCPPVLSREMAAGIPGARLVVIDNAGHYVTLDQPRAVARELRDWLAAPNRIPASTLSKELS